MLYRGWLIVEYPNALLNNELLMNAQYLRELINTRQLAYNTTGIDHLEVLIIK